jgi:hypothetical protein
MRLLVAYDTIDLANLPPGPERDRQLLGLRMAKTLSDLGIVDGDDEALLDPFEPILDAVTDPRFGWPFETTPESLTLAWPAAPPPRRLGEARHVELTPWALHSLVLGEWHENPPATFQLPVATCLMVCDGVDEGPAGRDLLRITSRIEVLALPMELHSFLLVAGVADGAGHQEFEFVLEDANRREVGFAIKDALLMEPSVPSFVVHSLDNLEIPRAGVYWFRLRVLGDERAAFPIEVHLANEPNPPLLDGRQHWTWDAQAFFGEHS